MAVEELTILTNLARAKYGEKLPKEVLEELKDILEQFKKQYGKKLEIKEAEDLRAFCTKNGLSFL